MRGTRLRAALGLARQQLGHERGRAALAVLGVAVAVVLMTVLTGLGYGMTSVGQEALTYIDQDVWVTAGPLQLAPGTVGGIRSSLLDAHEVSREIEERPDVARATAMSFQTVYVSPNRSAFTTVIGVGVTGNGSSLTNRPGGAFDRPDVHYANGTYDGPMTHAVVVDRSAADLLGVSVGDTLYIGGTLASARGHAFTVVGISNGYANFLGAPTVVVHLAELQEVTGTTGSDRAAMIGVTLTEDADAAAVTRELSRAYPDLRVRTRQEQFRAVFANQGAVLASAATLVVVALAAGTGLVANVLALLVAQQRRELAALKATGLRAGTLLGLVTGQGFAIAVLGGTLGLAATPVVVESLNRLVDHLVGFPHLIKTPWWVFAVGGGVALVMGLAGAGVAGWHVIRLSPLATLDE